MNSKTCLQTHRQRMSLRLAFLTLVAGGASLTVSPAQAQTLWTFDITNGNGSGADGSRVFDLNALLNGGQPFQQGKIAGGLTAAINADTSNLVPIGPPAALFYTGASGPVFFSGSDPTPFFHIVDANSNGVADFLDHNAVSGLTYNAVDNFTLGAFDATSWLKTLTPSGTSPVTFTGSFRYTLQAAIQGSGVSINLPARTPGVTSGSGNGPSVLFSATITAVPESGSVALFAALCLTGAGFLRRRRSR